MKAKIRGALFHCGRCGKSYSNPFGHVCITRIGRRPGKTTLRPTASVTCPKCHKPYANPVTHICTVRTDFKRKLAGSKKQAAADRRAQRSSLAKVKRAAARKGRPEHPRYSACRDGDCKRTGCLAYREGREAGYEDGFADGVNACPRVHA